MKVLISTDAGMFPQKQTNAGDASATEEDKLQQSRLHRNAADGSLSIAWPPQTSFSC